MELETQINACSTAICGGKLRKFIFQDNVWSCGHCSRIHELRGTRMVPKR